MNNYLVRVTLGKNNYEKLGVRNKFSRRLIDLPENVNEVLLWRQVRRTKARSLHIFKNTNNNNRRSATIFFENEEDLLNSSKFAVFYYNKKLKWDFSTISGNKNIFEKKTWVNKQTREEIQDEERSEVGYIDFSKKASLENKWERQEIEEMESSDVEAKFKKHERKISHREKGTGKEEYKKVSQREEMRKQGERVSSETKLRLMFEKFIAFSEKEGSELEIEEVRRGTRSPNRS
jgi:hypothetical protein